VSTKPLSTPAPLPSASLAINIISEIAALEPIAASLVLALVNGLKGKSDAQLLAEDSTTLGQIVSDAHAAAGQ
jgi:hypothetical protein